MDAAEFERVAETWATFHRRFAPLFGRPEAQDRSEQYLRGLLVQRGERRVSEDEVGGFLGDHHHGRVDVAVRHVREHGRVESHRLGFENG